MITIFNIKEGGLGMKVYKHIDELIGKTPLVELTNIEKEYSLNCKIYAKVEFF